jgi:hypothetical protein
MGRVGLLKGNNLFGSEVQRESGYSILKMMRLGGSYDWRSDCGLAEQPG